MCEVALWWISGDEVMIPSIVRPPALHRSLLSARRDCLFYGVVRCWSLLLWMTLSTQGPRFLVQWISDAVYGAPSSFFSHPPSSPLFCSLDLLLYSSFPPTSPSVNLSFPLFVSLFDLLSSSRLPPLPLSPSLFYLRLCPLSRSLSLFLFPSFIS